MRVLCVVPHNIKHETVMFLGLKAQGVDMHVVTTRRLEPDFTQLQQAGITVDVVPIRRRIDKAAIEQIRNIIESRDIQIVHAFNNRTISNALRACRDLPVRFIAYRGIVGNVSFLNPASWATYLNPRVDRIVCVAEAIRRSLLDLRLLWLKIAPEKPVTIYKGHDMAWYSGIPADLGTFGIPPGAFVVGCIANYRPRKGIEVLIDAFNRLPADADIHLLLIGHMQHRNVNRRLQGSLRQNRIHCIGHQSNAPEIQAACDICILPSIKREGLPKSVIEGMAYGVPPIVTDSGGSPELVEDGVSGLVVAPGSADAIAAAIERLYRNDTLRKSMGQAARRRIAEQFTPERTVMETLNLYRSLLG